MTGEKVNPGDSYLPQRCRRGVLFQNVRQRLEVGKITFGCEGAQGVCIKYIYTNNLCVWNMKRVTVSRYALLYVLYLWTIYIYEKTASLTYPPRD